MLKLTTIKDYCKKHNLTDTAVRKQIKTEKIKSVEFDNLTYIVEESREVEKLKSQIKLKNSNIKELKAKAEKFENQQERIIKLEAKIEKLENKLEEQRDKKEQLFEKVIAQYHILLPNNS